MSTATATAQAQGTNQQAFSVALPMDPDAFATGRADNFDGVIVSAYAYPYVGPNSQDNKHYLFVGVRIQPDPESGFDEFTESYFAGYLNSGYPSKDGKTPAGGTHDGYLALSGGKGNLDEKDGPCVGQDRHVIPTHPNVGTFVLGKYAKGLSWHLFCEAMRDCDEKGIIDKSSPGVDFCVGARCHFNRVPQKPKETATGSAKKDEKVYTTLLPTKLISVGNKVNANTNAGGVGAGASPSSANGANGAGNEAVNELIIAEILLQLKKAGEDGLTVGSLINSVPKALIVAGSIDKKQKGYVMGFIGDRDKDSNLPVNLVDIDDTTYVPSTDTLSLD